MADTASSIDTGSDSEAGQGNNELPTCNTVHPQHPKQPTSTSNSLFYIFGDSIDNIYYRIRLKSALVGKIVASVSVVIAGLTLWTTLAAIVDTKRAILLAEWTAKKDFFEFCESHDWKIDPARNATKHSPPGPPPVLGSRNSVVVVSKPLDEVRVVRDPKFPRPATVQGPHTEQPQEASTTGSVGTTERTTATRGLLGFSPMLDIEPPNILKWKGRAIKKTRQMRSRDRTTEAKPQEPDVRD
ncbi:hypothetical protein V8F20_007621 [Naviculisporaceae sp. PSN 640]